MATVQSVMAFGVPAAVASNLTTTDATVLMALGVHADLAQAVVDSAGVSELMALGFPPKAAVEVNALITA